MGTIGDDRLFGHGVMFLDGLFAGGGPARCDMSKWETTIIGDRVSIGGNATTLHMNILPDVVIKAGPVVARDINEHGVFAGNPAKLIKRLT